ncbi:MAG: hypothetical protein JWN62_2811 [Acidimicrobiales bacterium]|nr:hypothetical protein [Acidimicrobiales bacterium]
MRIGRAGTALLIGLAGMAVACTSQADRASSTTSAASTTLPVSSSASSPSRDGSGAGSSVPESAAPDSSVADTAGTSSSSPDTAATVSSAPVTSDSTAPAVPGLAADNDNAGSSTGITDDSINVAYIGADFSALAGTGLVPDLGDQQKQVQSFVDEINANGGIAGRQIKIHFKLISILAGGPDVIQAECIAATQEFQAAVVVLAPAAARDMARCTSVTNKTLTLETTAFDDALYSESQGRLISTGGMTVDRQFRAWADKMSELGYLDGKTIGVVVGDQPAEFSNAVNSALVPELEKLGHPAAQVITLPCTSSQTACEQYDVAATKLQESGVDTVFMELANTFGTGLIQAASDIDYQPKWFLEGNQVTDTVLKFLDSVKASLDGSVGVGFSFNIPTDINQGATDCNKIVSDRSGETDAPGSDAFGFVSNVCGAFQTLQLAGKQLVGKPLDQGTLIAAIEGLGTIHYGIGPDGSLSATKHDAGDYLFLCDYQAATGTCVRRSEPPFKVPA